MAEKPAANLPQPKLMGKGLPPTSSLRGAVSFQDLDKRSTATKSMKKGRSMRGGKR